MKIDVLCSTDVVIDTNVLQHAENPGNSQRSSALEVLGWLMNSTDAHWTLDDQGKVQPDISTSVLASEYYATLSPQAFALVLFSTFLSSGRVKFSPRPNATVRQTVRSLVPRNKNDQAVLGAAVGSTDRILISNDLDDFSQNVRKVALVKLGVLILDSDEAAA